MKLLLDQGLPHSTAGLLRSRGVEAVHTSEVGLAAADDGEILARAAGEGRIVVTLDADFHALLAAQRAGEPSVVRIRIEGLKASPLATLVEEAIGACAQELDRGAAVTVQPGKARVRLLPLR